MEPCDWDNKLEIRRDNDDDGDNDDVHENVLKNAATMAIAMARRPTNTGAILLCSFSGSILSTIGYQSSMSWSWNGYSWYTLPKLDMYAIADILLLDASMSGVSVFCT